jgi:hypothetical protein
VPEAALRAGRLGLVSLANVVVCLRHQGEASFRTVCPARGERHGARLLLALLTALLISARPAVAQLQWLDASLDAPEDRAEPVQLAQMLADPGAVELPSVASQELPGTQRRIRMFPRSSVPWQLQWIPSDDGQERIAVINSGVNIIIDQVAGFETVDISTDRIVIWTSAQDVRDFQGEAIQQGDTPWEFYLEGNVVFRQQDRVIYADRMYYNVRERYGVVLDGELLTPIPGYQGLVRLKAEVLRQVDPFRIEGFEGAVTTSRLGVPSYWLQSDSFTYESPAVSEVTPGLADPLTGQPQTLASKRVTSRDNRVYLGQWPIFYWPFMSADLERPTLYLESLSVSSDRVFGTQVLTEWNLYQLLGWRNAPGGTRWTGSVDYLSDRGWALGTHFDYDRNSFFGHPGRTFGFVDAWGINDDGLDNLGLGRRALEPETDSRGRILGRHRQFTHGLEITGELGWISDRNFLEQYYEQEWDEEKDQTTGVEIKRRNENHSISASADARINDFFTQTSGVRGDHFWIAHPLLSDWLTWTQHNGIAHSHLQVAEPPLNPIELAVFDPLAWEVDREGLRAFTRQRLDLPLQWGGAKIVPYVLGEAAHWDQDLSGNERDRLLGQAGIRGSLPLVRLDPQVQSTLFNVNGLAHKVVFESELLVAEADTNLADLPLYDPLDDDAIEFFRRRFLFTTFGGVAGDDVPLRFDERFYALRSGFQSAVAASSIEIADDLMLGRLAARQRWQTKRGMPGQQRVVDWITFDVEGFVYPKPDRDNFGQEIGLLSYDFRWHLGDRFSILSDAHADLFSDGLRTISLAAMVTRPGRARYLTGIRSIEGPISSAIWYGTTNIRLSPKWIFNYGSSYDFGDTGNIGQRGQIIRVGESFLVGLGFNYDHSRDNFGVRFSIEPRFLAGPLSRVGGVPIPPVGAFGLE